MSFSLNICSFFLADKLPNAFQRLDQKASLDFGGFLLRMVKFLADNEQSLEIRIAAAREIVRQLSIPSKFAMKVVKEKFGSIENQTKAAIVENVRFVFKLSNFLCFVSSHSVFFFYFPDIQTTSIC